MATALRSRSAAATAAAAKRLLQTATLGTSEFHPVSNQQELGCFSTSLGRSLTTNSSRGTAGGGDGRESGEIWTRCGSSESCRRFWERRHGQRQYASSSSSSSSSASKKSQNDGEAMASQMIGYAGTQRKNLEMHVEVSRVLEQGCNFLTSQGPSTATAAGKVLLALATFRVDGGKLQDAVDVLQQASSLEGASIDVGVSARQALVGVFLRMHKDEDALSEARSMVWLVNESTGLPLHQFQELLFRATATVQFAEHATSSKTGSLVDMSGLSSWLNHKEAHVEGIAAALVGIAECAHIRGRFSQAKDYYEKAAALAESSLAKGVVELSAVAMTADEVYVKALAGLGQVAAHLGDFDAAERDLTKALTHSEQINGEKHPRVGMVLACLADVYAQRGILKGSGGDIMITEGLYRKALDLLGAPPLDSQGKDVDLIDVLALIRARYAGVLSKVDRRENEAQKLQEWANAVWKGPWSLSHVFSQDASTKPAEITIGMKEAATDAYTGQYVVIDVAVGRVLYAPNNF